MDGTLAYYEHGMYPNIGEPIPFMLSLVKKWVARGEDVRIFTARMSNPPEEKVRQMKMIFEYCKLHVGKALPVTNAKDFNMSLLYDDRAIHIQENTGVPCCGER